MQKMGIYRIVGLLTCTQVLPTLEFRAGSDLGPTQNLAHGPWVLSGLTRTRFWVAQPSPNLKNCTFRRKIGQKSAKLGQNRSKSAARTGPWPKNASSNPTRTKKCQPEPDLDQKISGPTQPYLNLNHTYSSRNKFNPPLILSCTFYFSPHLFI